MERANQTLKRYLTKLAMKTHQTQWVALLPITLLRTWITPASKIHLSPCMRAEPMRACVLSHFSYIWFCVTLWTVVPQVPLSMGFSRQEYWSGLPCPSPGDLPNPEIKLWALYTSTIWKAHLSPYEILYGRPFLTTDLLVHPETHYLAQYRLVLGLTLKNIWEY